MAAGGGMEAGESPQKALIRELYEETGLTNVDVGNLLWECRFSFQYNNEDAWKISEDLIPSL